MAFGGEPSVIKLTLWIFLVCINDKLSSINTGEKITYNCGYFRPQWRSKNELRFKFKNDLNSPTCESSRRLCNYCKDASFSSLKEKTRVPSSNDNWNGYDSPTGNSTRQETNLLQAVTEENTYKHVSHELKDAVTDKAINRFQKTYLRQISHCSFYSKSVKHFTDHIRCAEKEEFEVKKILTFDYRNYEEMNFAN